MKVNQFTARWAIAGLLVAVCLTLISTPAEADGQRYTGTILAEAGLPGGEQNAVIGKTKDDGIPVGPGIQPRERREVPRIRFRPLIPNPLDPVLPRE